MNFQSKKNSNWKHCDLNMTRGLRTDFLYLITFLYIQTYIHTYEKLVFKKDGLNIDGIGMEVL